MCGPVTQTQYSMIGVIILCLPQTRISPGRTTGISFLCAHTLAHTYGLFTCSVPLGLSSPLHGGLLHAADEENEQTCSISLGACQRSDADVGAFWLWDDTQTQQKKKRRKKTPKAWQEDLSFAAVNASAFALLFQSHYNSSSKWTAAEISSLYFPKHTSSTLVSFCGVISAVKTII